MIRARRAVRSTGQNTCVSLGNGMKSIANNKVITSLSVNSGFDPTFPWSNCFPCSWYQSSTNTNMFVKRSVMVILVMGNVLSDFEVAL
jgi:hypothetical protein